MKIKNILSSKGAFLYLIVTTFTILSIAPLKAQVKRDHRTEKKDVKVNDHRTTNQTDVNSDVIYFDEGDALFGRRVELQRKYPGLKFTGKIDQIMITKKLFDGENLIHKTESGNTVYARVKKGKITRLSFRNPKIENDKDDTSNITRSFNDRTCFKCRTFCITDSLGNPLPCWTKCQVVDCSEEHNAEIPGKIVKQ